MKDPIVTVVATAELLQALHAADLALQASRARVKPDVAPLHALIVKVVQARRRVTQTLEAPASGLD